MITEAIAARKPVIALRPDKRNMNQDELSYLDDLISENWLRSIPLSAFSPQAIDRALSEIIPKNENHLEQLAELLIEKLGVTAPQLTAHLESS